jgi:hypothetical protein
MGTYELAGFLPPSRTVKLIDTQRQVKFLRADLYARLKQLFSDRIRFISLPGQQFRQIVEIDGHFRVAIYLCRAVNNTSAGEPGWLLRVRPLEKDFPALICTVDQSFSKLLNFYLVSPLADTLKYREMKPITSTRRRTNVLSSSSIILTTEGRAFRRTVLNMDSA